jgi:two-component system nitrate/nitrite response regulator NarL
MSEAPPRPNRGARVILAGGERPLRDAVRAGLANCGHRVVAEADDAVVALELSRHYRPDVLLLLDAYLGSRSALSVIEDVARTLQTVRTVLVRPDDADELELAALIAGAGACVPLAAWRRTLLPAIDAVVRGETLSSRRAAGDLVQRLQAVPTAGQGIRPVRSSLSDREWQVLDLLAAGCLPDEVSQLLGMSTTTVHTHLKHIYRKLGVHGRDAAIAAARELIEAARAS